ncbi:MAG: hypothetical protein EHJ95_03225, partial [Methanobacteriota archaeon]
MKKTYLIVGILFLIAIPITVLAVIPADPQSTTTSTGFEPGVPGILSPLGLTPSWPAYPDISGTLVVYQDNRSGNWDIFL